MSEILGILLGLSMATVLGAFCVMMIIGFARQAYYKIIEIQKEPDENV